MKSFYIEAFVDERPIHRGTYQGSSESAVSSRAWRDARKTGLIKRSATKFSLRMTKLASVKATVEAEQ